MYDNWFAANVIILSVMLAVFLLLSIILLVKLIQISSQVKKIVDHAEQAADKAEHIVSFFEKSATPVAIVKLFANISESFYKTAEKVNNKRSKK